MSATSNFDVPRFGFVATMGALTACLCVPVLLHDAALGIPVAVAGAAITACFWFMTEPDDS
jgi:hypothetical protein